MTSRLRITWILIGLTGPLGLDMVICNDAAGQVITLPTAARSTSGLRLTIDANWVDGPGYRPVTVRVETASGLASTVDRELLVEFCPNARYRRRRELTASRYLRLAEGESTATGTLYLLMTEQVANTRVNVWVDGTRIPDLCIEGYFGSPRSNAIEPVPHVLVVAKGIPTREERNRKQSTSAPSDIVDVPELESLVAIIPNSHGESRFEVGRNQLRPADRLRLALDHHAITLVRPDELPISWIGLTAVDFVFSKLNDLVDMHRSDAERFRALCDWAEAGGTLCVYDVGNYDNGLAQLSQLMGIRIDPADEGSPWNGVTRSAFRDLGRGSLRILQWHLERNPNDKKSRQEEAQFTFEPPPFLHRSLGFGRVVAVDGSPFSRTELFWQLFFHEIEPSRWLWSQRHGLSLIRENRDYWNFVIPGAGVAPVGAFLVIISLFTLAIGPVNYYLLHRFHRLNWLLMTVPLGALVVTGGLVAYALLADGLGVQLRARSMTLLDSDTGNAISWSRQTYYAGLVPSKGLIFPKDAAVYPLEQYPQGNAASSTARHLTWDEHQHLRSGFITSRWQAQFLVIHPAVTSASVPITESSGFINATNHLGEGISWLFVRDGGGNYFHERNIIDERTVTLKSMGQEKAVAELRKIGRDDALSLVDQLAGDDRSLVNLNRSRYYSGRGRGFGLDPVSQSTSLLEQELSRLGNADFLPPRHFVAILERSPSHLPLGVTGAREKNGYHVVLGSW